MTGVFTLPQPLFVALGTGIATVFFAVACQSYLPSLLGRGHLVEGNGKLETNCVVASMMVLFLSRELGLSAGRPGWCCPADRLPSPRSQARRGSIHIRPGNRPKSSSAEHRVAPCSIAKAARCASGTRLPAVPIAFSRSRNTAGCR